MLIHVLERVPVEEVNKLLKNSRVRYRREYVPGARCRFRSDLVEGVAYVHSPRVDSPPWSLSRRFLLSVINVIGRRAGAEALYVGICSLSVETYPDYVQNFRKINPADAPPPAMRYLSVPGHFWVRGKVVSVTRDDNGTAQVVDIAAGDAELAVGSADIGNEAQLEAQLSVLAEGDLVEFEVCFLWFSEEGD